MATETIEAPMTGTIKSVKVKSGDKVNEGDEICELEAMKTVNSIYTPVSGTVTELNVAAGQTIKGRQTIAVIEY